MKWGAVVAAGGLVAEPLASALGTPRKALARLGGVTSLERVLAAVRDAGIAACVTLAGEDVRRAVIHGDLAREGRGHVESATAGLQALPDCDAVLFLPADIPLVTASALRSFVHQVEVRVGTRASSGLWFAAGLCRLERFQAEFPELADRETIRMKEGSFVGGTLLACSPASFAHGHELLEQVSGSRASQLRMIWRLGPLSMVRYFWQRVSLVDAEQVMGRLLGGQAVLIHEVDASAMADFDQVDDFMQLARRFQEQNQVS